MLGLIAAYLAGRWDADRAYDFSAPAAPCQPTSSTYDVLTVAERQAARANMAAGSRALGLAPQPEPERHELAPTGDERAWRIVLPLLAVLTIAVALLA